MNIFINCYNEMRSGWAMILGILMTNILSLPGMLLFTQLVMPHYENIVQKPISYTLLETGIYLLQQVSLVVGSIIAFNICSKRSARQIGYNLSHMSKNLLLGFTVGIITITLSFLLLFITGQVEIIGINTSAIVSGKFWMCLVIFISVGFGEETFVRGFMMTVLKTTRRPVLVLLLPSLLFSVLHLFNQGYGLVPFINIFLLGVLFSVLFLRSGSIWAPIMAHFIWNWMQGCFFGMNVSGFQTVSILKLSVTGKHLLLTGGTFGNEGSLLITIVLLVTIAMCFFLLKSSNNDRWTLSSDLPFVRKKAYLTS